MNHSGTTAAAATAAPKGGGAGAAKYLTVTLDGEAYGIAVREVREIIRLQKITPVPHVPE